jgi:katanin p60 ATPase-containing subunit A1
LVLDNTYEYFVYDAGRPFHCVEAPHVINIFSFSKAYGMMGWRQGYLSYIDSQVDVRGNAWSLEAQLLKCQDTIPICPTIVSQHVALGALQDAGKSWVQSKLEDVVRNQQLIREVLVEAVGESNVWGGQGAIYLFVRLPPGVDDNEVVKELALVHKVVIIPGTACGAPGHVRVSYANLVPEKCVEAAERLRSGLQRILQETNPSNRGKE